MNYIKNVFPTDYNNISKTIFATPNYVKLRKEKMFFEVHPENDFPFKIRCMILSSAPKEKYLSVSKLTKEMKLSHDNVYWKDYMFQIPGIYKMLGIHRDYHVEHFDYIEKTLQKPLPFLYLAQIRLEFLKKQDSLHSTLRMFALDMVEIALDAYENKKNSNDFDTEQIDTCMTFLFGHSLYECATIDRGIYEPQESGVWRLDQATTNHYSQIEERLEAVIYKYIEEMEQAPTIDRTKTYKNYLRFNFPEFMKPIICGFYKYYDQLPFSSYEDVPNNATFWNNRNIPVFPGVDENTEGVFYDLVMYIINKHTMKEHAVSLVSCREMKSVDKYLQQYYTFCIGTLAYVFSENDKNMYAAQDSFERLFSLYLFEEETELLYSIISSVAEDLLNPKLNENFLDIEKNTKEGLELALAKFMADFFSSDILHEIFCSPGIFHRISLARYICNIAISKDRLSFSYNLYKDDAKRYCEANELRTEIQNINRVYQYEELLYTNKKISETKKNKIYLGNLDGMCDAVSEYSKYKKFYEKFDSKIENCNLLSKKGKNTKAPHIKNVAKNILKEGNFKSPAYRFLHFWVIMSSFLPNHISYPSLKYPLIPRKKP